MANPRLCEIIAVVSERKGDTQKAVTDMYHKLQKADLFDGFTRTYKPREENGEALPGEQKFPQLRVNDLIDEANAKWVELLNLTLTLDRGNCAARGDVEVDGKVIMADVPAATLLFLEKQLDDVKTFVGKMPVPDPAMIWTHGRSAPGRKRAVHRS